MSTPPTMSTSHITNEDLKSQMSTSQKWFWGFSVILTVLLSLLCFMAKALVTKVDEIPNQINSLTQRIAAVELKIQVDSSSHVSTSDWAAQHSTLEGRIAETQSKVAVIESRLDGIAKTQEDTKSAVDRLQLTFTGFQIDLNRYNALSLPASHK